jgi:hypothetical protein
VFCPRTAADAVEHALRSRRGPGICTVGTLRDADRPDRRREAPQSFAQTPHEVDEEFTPALVPHVVSIRTGSRML